MDCFDFINKNGITFFIKQSEGYKNKLSSSIVASNKLADKKDKEWMDKIDEFLFKSGIRFDYLELRY
jgi:hypothetical protein